MLRRLLLGHVVTVAVLSVAAPASAQKPIDVVAVSGTVTGGLVSQAPVPDQPVPEIKFVVRQWPGADRTAYVAALELSANVACDGVSSLSTGQLAGELPIEPGGHFGGTLSSTSGLSVSVDGEVGLAGTPSGTARVVAAGGPSSASCDTGTLTWTAAYHFKPPVRAAMVRVPRLVGLKLGLAEHRLRAWGLTWDTAGGHRYAPANPRGAFQDHVAVVPSRGADRQVVGQDVSAGQRVAAGSTVGLTTVRAPGDPQFALPAVVRGFALGRDDRTLTVRFRELPARCHPIDHVELVTRAHWIIVQVLVVFAESPDCDRSPLVSRSVRLELPSSLMGRPILTQQPTFPRTDLIAPSITRRWSGYLTPDHRTAVITFTYGSCDVLARADATVTDGIAHVTLYEGATQTFFPCIAIAYSGETFVRLPRPARALAGAGPPLPPASDHQRRAHEREDDRVIAEPATPWA